MGADEIRFIKLFTLLLAIFMISVFAGSYLPDEFKESVFSQVVERFKDLLNQENQLQSLDQLFNLVYIIYTNNLMVALVIYILFPTVIGSVLMLITQGVLIGAVITYSEVERGLKETLQLLGCSNPTEAHLEMVRVLSLLPHGIVEVPAIVIAVIASLRMSSYIVDVVKRRFWSKKQYGEEDNTDQDGEETKYSKLKKHLKDSLKYLLVAALLLLIAAFIEVFITPVVVALSILITC